MTKTFRYGKEYARLFSRTVECISLTDFVQDFEEEETEEDFVSDGKSKQPVIRSNLKFAAHGAKFLKNYLNNLSKYVIRMNQILAPNSNEEKEKQEKCKGFLS